MHTPETEASQVAVSHLGGCQKEKGPVWQERRKQVTEGTKGREHGPRSWVSCWPQRGPRVLLGVVLGGKRSTVKWGFAGGVEQRRRAQVEGFARGTLRLDGTARERGGIEMAPGLPHLVTSRENCFD